MTNLTTTANSIKKYAWVLLTTLIIAALGFLIYSRFVSPPEPTPKTQLEPPTFQTIPVKSTSFASNNLSSVEKPPRKLSVYRRTINLDFRQRATEIAQKFEIQNEPQKISDINLGEGLLFSDQNSVLVIYQDFLTFQKSTPQKTAASQPTVSLEELRIKAVNTIQSLGLAIDIPQDYSISYTHYIGDDSIEDDNPQDAARTNFKFHYHLSDLKVVAPTTGVSVSFDNLGNLTKINLKAQDQTTAIGQYPLIDLKTALKALNSGEGHLIQIKGKGEIAATTNKTLEQTLLRKAYVAYYLPPKVDQTIQPIWVFEGESQINNNPVYLTYAIPAIDQKFLVSPRKP